MVANPKIEVEETNLEDLILLGEDKKVTVVIEYPTDTGGRVKAKALIKQLTLRELDDLKISQNNVLETNVQLLKKALFTSNGENFTEEMILSLPMGVVNALSDKIMELSGVNTDNTQRLMDF